MRVKTSVLPKNTTQCPWPSLEPRPLNPEMNALTMRPLHLYIHNVVKLIFCNNVSKIHVMTIIHNLINLYYMG